LGVAIILDVDKGQEPADGTSLGGERSLSGCMQDRPEASISSI
jgi:hypothetical protein